MVVMPASMACDHLGRKWTIIPSCLGMAAALSLMAVSGQHLEKASAMHKITDKKCHAHTVAQQSNPCMFVTAVTRDKSQWILQHSAMTLHTMH